MSIKILPDFLVNQIAAGEVVERPASIVKELIENAIDANADKINITYKNAGRNFIAVADNGVGIKKHELNLALTRHATSKMDQDKLFNINTLGFRGEALAAMTAVAKVEIISKHQDDDIAWSIIAEEGKKSQIKPDQLNQGTIVKISELFENVPARQKFLKSEKAESNIIMQTILNMAMAYPQIEFATRADEIDKKKIPAEYNQPKTNMLEKRIRNIIGNDFIDNSIPIQAVGKLINMYGYIAMPTYNQARPYHQYTFVNKRWVKDKLIMATIKAAYADTIPKGRFPIFVIFIDIKPDEIDVNVHPAKREIRFKEAAFISSFIVSNIKNALAKQNSTQTTTPQLQKDLIHKITQNLYYKNNNNNKSQSFNENITASFECQEQTNKQHIQQETKHYYNPNITKFPKIEKQNPEIITQNQYLGYAKAQIYDNYIVSQNENEIVIIDQHAAHERILYEKLKKNYRESKMKTQALLVPEIVKMKQEDIEKIKQHKKLIQNCGINVENFGDDAVIVREMPVELNKYKIKNLLEDVVAEVSGAKYQLDKLETLEETVFAVLSKIACYGSIRSGRNLTIEEMNVLMRKMEQTQNSAVCNHGRPTYIKLSLNDIEKLFERR